MERSNGVNISNFNQRLFREQNFVGISGNGIRCIEYNLAAYCLIVTARYRDRNADSQPFMSAKTFRKFWSSHWLIEFREMCHWCGESPKVLAGDGAKIRVSMQKISIVPTESASKDEVIQ